MRLAYPRLFPFRFPIQRFRMSAIASSSPSGVILYTHAACEGHAIQGHPEQPRRIPVTLPHQETLLSVNEM